MSTHTILKLKYLQRNGSKCFIVLKILPCRILKKEKNTDNIFPTMILLPGSSTDCVAIVIIITLKKNGSSVLFYHCGIVKFHKA